MTDPSFTAVVLAAGKGTRMRSSLAKVLHPICGRPLGWFAVKAALDAGAARVVVVVGHQAQAVRAALESHLPGAPLAFVEQTEQRGTGHAVQCALPALGESPRVLIVYGDVPLVRAETLRALIDAGRQAPLALITARPADPAAYGRIVRDEAGRVLRIVEHKDAGPAERAINEMNAGLYCVERSLLEDAVGELTAENAQGELYLTDVVALAAGRGLPIATVEVPEFLEVSGVNDRVELARAGRTLRMRLNEAHMLAGVSMEDPETTYVDAGVVIGPDTTLGANVHLMGRTELEGGVQIRANSVLEDTVVRQGSVVGPFARLRPGTVLEQGVHVGNFVECKKAHLGPGVKAGHLTYLGDAEIGEGTNVGAGTITCNYDGVAKHQTTIGKGAFIGSNTALVAPVRVGDEAYVGAGSTITSEIPDGALGVARGKQHNVEGWAKRRAGRRKA